MKYVLFLLFAAGLLFQTACKRSVTCKDFDAANPFACAEDKKGRWFWIPVSGMQCRDGSPSGIGVRLRSENDKLVIYMEGGGACYDVNTCEGNPSTADESEFSFWANSFGKEGIFSSSKNNPFRDWNFIYVPYCTGDLHAGSLIGNVPDGPAGQVFYGYNNMGLVLDLIKPYFGNLNNVLLTGQSAGGFGATFNFIQVAEAFPNSNLSLINDGGPMPDRNDAFAPCYQQLIRNVFGLDAILPAGCGGCVGADGDGLSELYRYLGQTYTNLNFGLVSSTEDAVLRDFFGDGQANCSSTNLLPDGVLTAGVRQLRDSVLIPTGNWSTFITAGFGHTFIGGDDFYDKEITGISMAAWCEAVINGQMLNLEE